jgi:hypothetical protein
VPRDSIDRVLGRSRYDAAGGSERELRQGRGAQVIVPCDSDDDRIAYVRRLAAHGEELRVWGAELFAIVADGRADSSLAGVTWLIAPDGAARSDVAVVVTDQWGEVYFGVSGVAVDALPSPDEIIEWVRFVAIQCEECERPEGAWRDL